MKSFRAADRSCPGQLLVLATWFGIVTGLVEGIGLLVFQQVNAANWARMIHVSAPILWISIIVDLLFFWAVALGSAAVSRFVPRSSALKLTVSLLSGLAIYDWVALSGRLYYLSCLLLAVGGALAFQRWFSQHERAALRFWGKTTPALVGVAVLVFASVQGGAWWKERQAEGKLPAAIPGSPNVVVIVLDALRADHVSAYGYPRATTPDVDRMASEGALFENAISTSSWSLPSHGSLVTGRYEFEHGADKPDSEAHWAWGRVSFAGYPMLGAALQKRGYRAGAFSANRAFFTHNDGFGRGFLHFEDYFDSAKDSFLRTLYGREFLRLYLARGRRYVLHKRADKVNQELLQWIDHNRQRPFFAFLNYFDVHDPYGGPPSYRKPPWELKTTIDEYDAGARYDNDYVAQLMEALEQRGMAKDTIVVITSDHGESLGQHGLSTHGRALYWELVHVPLVIWYPGHVPAGTRVARPVTNAAIPATVMELVGAGGQNDFPGPALSLLWKTPEAGAHWPVPLAEMARNPYPEKEEKTADQMEPTSTTGAIKSLVTPRWHLIAHENLGHQLYDLVHDPAEKNNLINTPEAKAAELNLNSLLKTLSAKFSSPPAPERMATATVLPDGKYDFNVSAAGVTHKGINQYYRITSEPGTKITVEVHAHASNHKSRFDPVLAIEDGQGEPLQTCRNRGDDHLRPPGLPDATPDSFDDLCINDDDELGTNPDARLELLTPGSAGTRVELYLHVLDWNEPALGPKSYQLVIAGAFPHATPMKANTPAQ